MRGAYKAKHSAGELAPRPWLVVKGLGTNDTGLGIGCLTTPRGNELKLKMACWL